jgi:hypothetical protein
MVSHEVSVIGGIDVFRLIRRQVHVELYELEPKFLTQRNILLDCPAFYQRWHTDNQLLNHDSPTFL